MRVELRRLVGHVTGTQVEVVGVVELHDGIAVPDERAAEILSGAWAPVIVKPGEPRRRLSLNDGAEFLEALQHNLRGTYLWATAPIE